MKKLLLLLLIAPVLGFGQYTNFDSVEHYNDAKKTFNRTERENRVKCT